MSDAGADHYDALCFCGHKSVQHSPVGSEECEVDGCSCGGFGVDAEPSEERDFPVSLPDSSSWYLPDGRLIRSVDEL